MTHKSERAEPSACLALVHHANQYVITDGYQDRQGMADILGMRGPSASPTGLIPLLRMHLEFGVPLNLHMSGTFLETLAWHYPQVLSLLKQLLREGLFELVGSAFSQNIMPFFADDQNVRQINDEIWLYRRHLGCDPATLKAFWVPERVWDTTRLAPVLRSPRLLNGGYRYVLLDDRMLFPVGDRYDGSPRQRFDRDRPRDITAFQPWDIVGSDGLRVLPISYQLRYLIPPIEADALSRLSDLFGWLAARRDAEPIAIYGDDLEKSAGVGGWDPLHPERYERFLRCLVKQNHVAPVLLSEWAERRGPAGARPIERGTFYELAQNWNAGEDYRNWFEDSNCQAHRAFLTAAERSLTEAGEKGADRALLGLGWRHFRHSTYETSWHRVPVNGEPSRLEAWAGALTSHARSCLVIARAAEWFVARDGLAHVEQVDIDQDGDLEIVLKNDHLFAVLTPRWGGRLLYLFDLTGRIGRLVVGNISDDWNLQEDLNRYMDCPRNHPGGLADVGHEHDRHHPTVTASEGSASVRLRNVQTDSAIYGTEKTVTLAAHARQLTVDYTVAPRVWRLSTECCFSPDYYSLLRHGRRRLAPIAGTDWRGWRNGSSRIWLRLGGQRPLMWDRPHQPESGHGMNLRVTAVARQFRLEIGVGLPQRTRAAAAVRPEAAPAKINGTRLLPAVAAIDARAMRTYFNRAAADVRLDDLPVRDCGVRILKPHHNKLTIEYVLSFAARRNRSIVSRTLIGLWRQDTRGADLFALLSALVREGVAHADDRRVPRPYLYSPALRLLVTDKAAGSTIKQQIGNAGADWPALMRHVARWIAYLHRSRVEVSRQAGLKNEVQILRGWLDDVRASNEPWLRRHKRRTEDLIQRLASCEIRSQADWCLVHGDYHPENVLVRRDRVSVIDFEHCAMGDPGGDLGCFVAQLDIQAERGWRRRGLANPIATEELGTLLLEEYRRLAPGRSCATVPLHQARMYLKHIVHTLRMKGTEEPELVDRWLERAGRCLERQAWVAPRPPRGRSAISAAP
jgi:hypothetical protein